MLGSRPKALPGLFVFFFLFLFLFLTSLEICINTLNL